jgi:hypothetical protein
MKTGGSDHGFETSREILHGAQQAPKSDGDLEAAKDNQKVLPEAYAVRADSGDDELYSEQEQPSYGAPVPGDNASITNEDQAGFPTGWCLLSWFSFLFCFMPVVSLQLPFQQCMCAFCVLHCC